MIPISSFSAELLGIHLQTVTQSSADDRILNSIKIGRELYHIVPHVEQIRRDALRAGQAAPRRKGNYQRLAMPSSLVLLNRSVSNSRWALSIYGP